MNSLLAFFIAILLSSPKGDIDSALDRYEALCDSCIAIRERISKGQAVNASALSPLLIQLDSIKNSFLQSKSVMTDVQRVRFAFVRDKYYGKAHYVDMGLSVLWATENLCDANGKPAYFAWAETMPKKKYSLYSNYPQARIEYHIAKYNTDTAYGAVDNKTVLDSEDDAATSILGRKWHTPTRKEWYELAQNCDIFLDTVNNKVGWRARSRVDGYQGRSIFFPFTTPGKGPYSGRTYLTSNISKRTPYHEYHALLDSRSFGVEHQGQRTCRNHIRPVSSVSNIKTVDLGLSVKWAKMNLGACAPEDFGDFFLYGHNAPTGSAIDNKYMDCDTVILKYVADDGYGQPDGRSRLEPDDDAATCRFGARWRIPSTAEFEELMDNCSCEWIEDGDRCGVRFTSRVKGFKGKSIFLPAYGYKSKITNQLNKRCYYWTNELYSSITVNCFNASSFSQGISHGSRFLGLPIRPVIER